MRYLSDVPRHDRDQDVERLQSLFQHTLNIADRVDQQDVRTEISTARCLPGDLPAALGKVRRPDFTRPRISLASTVNVGHDDLISILQAAGELVCQRGR